MTRPSSSVQKMPAGALAATEWFLPRPYLPDAGVTPVLRALPRLRLKTSRPRPAKRAWRRRSGALSWRAKSRGRPDLLPGQFTAPTPSLSPRLQFATGLRHRHQRRRSRAGLEPVLARATWAVRFLRQLASGNRKLNGRLKGGLQFIRTGGDFDEARQGTWLRLKKIVRLRALSIPRACKILRRSCGVEDSRRIPSAATAHRGLTEKPEPDRAAPAGPLHVQQNNPLTAPIKALLRTGAQPRVIACGQKPTANRSTAASSDGTTRTAIR